MGTRKKVMLGKVLYGALFVIALPILLYLWAIAAEDAVPLPAIQSGPLGLALAALGLIVMGIATLNLWVMGKGLPMSPYPPMRLVTGGVYRYVAHPIYTGAAILLAGLAIFGGSAAALWLVAPVFILACTAFVLGFEKVDLEARHPGSNYRPLIAIPPASDEQPTGWDRASAYILLMIPWATIHSLLHQLGAPQTPVKSYLFFEAGLPVLPAAAALYLLVYPLVAFAPLFAPSRKSLRDFVITGLIAAAIGFYLMIISPFETPAKIIPGNTIWRDMLEFGSFWKSSYLAFPSFHVIWTWVAVGIYADRFPSMKWIWRGLAILITLSCIAVGQYSIADIAGGLLVFAAARKRWWLWNHIRSLAEAVANSWREWDFGPVRLLSHGFLGGLAVFVGILLTGTLLGPAHLEAILIVVISGMIISALWAQFIEGSKKLLRPLGFYGGVIGVIIGAWITSILFGEDFFLIWGAFAVAAPWIQGIGRLRCLVQGCCHGRPVSADWGIRYFHFRSRVVKLAEMRGEFLHPTPVYSILTNLVTGLFLLKLWFAQASLPLIIGMCFILNSLGRFVEEALRGEPQTPIYGGLRLYQWIAAAGVIVGAYLSTVSYQAVLPAAGMSSQTLLAAVAGGIIAIGLTGVDFPLSNRRFSRLV